MVLGPLVPSLALKMNSLMINGFLNYIIGGGGGGYMIYLDLLDLLRSPVAGRGMVLRVFYYMGEYIINFYFLCFLIV